jgi:hypothetical protein
MSNVCNKNMYIDNNIVRTRVVDHVPFGALVPGLWQSYMEFRGINDIYNEGI